jgi:hypothetical protein
MKIVTTLKIKPANYESDFFARVVFICNGS